MLTMDFKEILLGFAAFIVLVVFGLLYMAHSNAIYYSNIEQSTNDTTETHVLKTHQPVQNNQVLGIVE